MDDSIFGTIAFTKNDGIASVRLGNLTLNVGFDPTTNKYFTYYTGCAHRIHGHADDVRDYIAEAHALAFATDESFCSSCDCPTKSIRNYCVVCLTDK